MRPNSKSMILRWMSWMRRWARTYILWQLQMSKRSLVRGLNDLDDEQLRKLGIRRNEIEPLVTVIFEVLGGSATEPPDRPFTEGAGSKASASPGKSCAFVSAICG